MKAQIFDFFRIIAKKEYNKKVHFQEVSPKFMKKIYYKYKTPLQDNKNKYLCGLCIKSKKSKTSKILINHFLPKKDANLKGIYKILIHEVAHLKSVTLSFIENENGFKIEPIKEHQLSFYREYKKLRKKYPFRDFIIFLDGVKK